MLIMKAFLIWSLLFVAIAVAVEQYPASWNQTELEIVGEKLKYCMGPMRGRVINELKKKHGWVVDLPVATRPTAPKVNVAS